MLRQTVQRQLLPKRNPSPSLRSQGGLPSGGEAGAPGQSSGRGSLGIDGKGSKRASEQRRDPWAASTQRTLSSWAGVAQEALWASSEI